MSAKRLQIAEVAVPIDAQTAATTASVVEDNSGFQVVQSKNRSPLEEVISNRRLAEAGNVKAARNIADMFYEGRIFKTDEAQFQVWSNIADQLEYHSDQTGFAKTLFPETTSSKSDGEAHYKTAFKYVYTTEGKGNPVEFLFHLFEATQHGHPAAYAAIAIAFNDDQVLKTDPNLYARHMKTAADKNYPPAERAFGLLCLANGDRHMATEYLKDSAEHGNEDAKLDIERHGLNERSHPHELRSRMRRARHDHDPSSKPV